MQELHIIQVGDVLVSPDIITEKFCCDLDKCKGECCVEGDAGVDKQGVAYNDRDGDLVTSIVNGKDCVFTCYENGCCLCALERAYRGGKTKFIKPISCALYPIREKRFAGGLVGLNYNRWDVCRPAVEKGRELELPVYKFLEGPLVRRFGKEWYQELCETAEMLLNEDK